MIKVLSSKGRKKIKRCTSFDINTLVCTCRGPTQLTQEELQARPKILLYQEELQTLVDRDIDKKTMMEGAECMEISKTVYAGIYTSARQKLTQSLIQGAVLVIECQKK